jgi:hypothetical protein
MYDGANVNLNFKLVTFDRVATALGLKRDPIWDPRAFER